MSAGGQEPGQGPTSGQYATDLTSGLTYADWFSLRVAWLRGATAARFLDRELTYAEVNARANRLAGFLQSIGVGPEVVVAVCLERSLDLPVTLLAIWKAGGAFLTLDPDHPLERLKYLLTDSQAAVLLTQNRLRERFFATACRLVCIDDPGGFAELPEDDPKSGAGPDNLAYVMYTSGSTGAPKGVEITQRALLNHSLVTSHLYQLCPADRVLQFASFSFDVALEELFPAWLSGSAVVLRGPDTISSVYGFLNFVEREHISVLNVPTAYWHELVSGLGPGSWPASVRLVIIGGERASDRLFRRWKEVVPSSVKLINAYGPTEATITAVAYEADVARDTLPIGKPLTNSYAVVLDQRLREVRPGTVGELYLGGVGLARGYRRRPELTAERFIPNPLASVSGERLYRTGDLARVGPDGNLEFVGRVDDQIKVRGFRIEPGEIEAALRDCSFVKDAVVVAREDRPGHTQLVGYVVPEPGQSPSVSQLRASLAERLPGYMIPTQFASLDSLPRTVAGKVDRQALPVPDDGCLQPDESFVPASSRTEQEVAAIWRQVLRLEKAGVLDDFFEAGGDSLLALQIVARLRERFGFEFPLSRFFGAPNISAIAAALEAEIPRQVSPSVGGMAPPPTGQVPASLIQEQLYFLHEVAPQSDAYHMACAFRVRGRLDVGALERALNVVVARHEALRTHLDYCEGNLAQFVTPKLHVPISILSLAHVPRRDRQASLEKRLAMEARQPFDLRKSPLCRISLFRLSERDHVLLLVLHHSIADGWSLGVLMREWEQSYVAMTSASSQSPLPELRSQYGDYTRWQRRLIKEPGFGADLTFWRQALADAPRAIVWPELLRRTEPHPGASASAERSAVTLSVGVDSTEKLLRKRRLTPFMSLLGALALSLWKWTGQVDLVLGTVVAGRSRREFENVIGCFMNFVPLRLRVQAEAPGVELLDGVRRAVIEAQCHQECPFEEIVRATGAARNAARNPLFNVALLWHNYPAGRFAPPGVRSERIEIATRTPLLDLRFEAEPRGDDWVMACEYDAALFENGRVASLMRLYTQALHFLIRTPDKVLREFPLAHAPPARFWPALFARLKSRSKPGLAKGRLQTDHG